MKFFYYVKKHPTLFSLAIFFMLVVGAFSVRIRSTRAIIPFGGMITSITYCPCSDNLLVSVGAPAGGVFTLDPESATIDAYYQVYRPGPWALGTYNPGSVGCWWPSVDGCFEVASAEGTIDEVGTSM